MDVLNPISQTPFFLLVGVCGMLLVFQLYFLLFVYSRLAFYKKPPEKKSIETLPLSVVICARNEEENLRKNLPAILNQDYPRFEVVVVNDFSEDETTWLLKEMCKQHGHLKVVEIAEHVRGLVRFGKVDGV